MERETRRWNKKGNSVGYLIIITEIPNSHLLRIAFLLNQRHERSEEASPLPYSFRTD